MKSNKWATGVNSTRLASLMSGPIPMAKICFLVNCIKGFWTIIQNWNGDLRASRNLRSYQLYKSKIEYEQSATTSEIASNKAEVKRSLSYIWIRVYALPSPTPPGEPCVVIEGLLKIINYRSRPAEKSAACCCRNPVWPAGVARGATQNLTWKSIWRMIIADLQVQRDEAMKLCGYDQIAT